MLPVVPALLAVAFAWAAAAKAARPRAWKEALGGYRLPRGLGHAALVGVPVAEGAVAALLVAGGDAAKAGAAGSVALLSAFSATVLRARRLRGDRLPCGCFGGGGNRDYRLMLVRNATLGAVAAAILSIPRVASYEVDAPAPSQVLPAVLAASGLVLIVWLGVTFARPGGRVGR